MLKMQLKWDLDKTPQVLIKLFLLWKSYIQRAKKIWMV